MPISVTGDPTGVPGCLIDRHLAGPAARLRADPGPTGPARDAPAPDPPPPTAAGGPR